MLSKIVKSTALLALITTAVNAADFNAGAEKDRIEAIKYFEANLQIQKKIRINFSLIQLMKS